MDDLSAALAEGFQRLDIPWSGTTYSSMLFILLEIEAEQSSIPSMARANQFPLFVQLAPQHTSVQGVLGPQIPSP
jgi:hypothetical protein